MSASTGQDSRPTIVREVEPFLGLVEAVPRALMLNVELISITRRNVYAGLELISKLYGPKRVMENVALQTAFWRHQVSAFIGAPGWKEKSEHLHKAHTVKRVHSAMELEAIMNAELRSCDASKDLSVRGITPITDTRRPYNWEPKLIQTGATVRNEACKRALNDILDSLQQKYDLGPQTKARRRSRKNSAVLI